MGRIQLRLKLWRVYNRGWARWHYYICAAETEAEALCLAKAAGFGPKKRFIIEEIYERVIHVRG